jgi:uncharacterized protein (TIGR02145 family)
MRTKLSVRVQNFEPLTKIALAATLAVAITLTFSCSGGDDNGDPDDKGDGNATGGSNGSCNIGDYRTVQIGTQRWMAENWNCNVGSSVCYDNKPANCAKYGRLYNWTTANGVCPPGWHLPSDAEWTTLTDYVGGSSTAGIKLKSTSGWSNDGNGTDAYGFSALPGGYGLSYGRFKLVGDYGYWWSATEYSASSAYLRCMYYYGAHVDRGNYNDDKANFFSVRCAQD